MPPKRRNLPDTRGSMLITAIFVLVVMSILGLAMVRLVSTSANSVVYDIYGQRALNAARSGLELKLSQAFPLSGTAVTCSVDNTATSLTATGFENCQFQAQCQQTPVTFADGSSQIHFEFSSTGKCLFDGRTVSRTLSVDGLN